jgi:rare lipoprotein A
LNQASHRNKVKDLALVLLLAASPAVASPSAEEFMVEPAHGWDVPDSSQPEKAKAADDPEDRPTSRLLQVVNGAASWYGPGFYGRQTASGERLRRGTLTAAHRTLPFGTRVRVTNLENGRTVVVRINDRGPFRAHRVIDLAHGAASELQMMRSGEVPVRLEVLR